MLYYRARYYLPEIGRFLQKDPKPGALDLPLSFVNAYSYVANNPANVLDPSGMGWWSEWGRTAFITAVIITAAAFTGGLAAVAFAGGSAVAGAVIGAGVGAGVAGGLRAAWNITEGRSWSDGVLQFAVMGAIAGGMAGYNAAQALSNAGSGSLATNQATRMSDVDVIFSGNGGNLVARIGFCSGVRAATPVISGAVGAIIGGFVGSVVAPGPGTAAGISAGAKIGAIVGGAAGIYGGITYSPAVYGSCMGY